MYSYLILYAKAYGYFWQMLKGGKDTPMFLI